MLALSLLQDGLGAFEDFLPAAREKIGGSFDVGCGGMLPEICSEGVRRRRFLAGLRIENRWLGDWRFAVNDVGNRENTISI